MEQVRPQQPTQPISPQKMAEQKETVKSLLRFFITVDILVTVFGGWWYWHAVFSATDYMQETTAQFTVEEGDGVAQIASQLEEADIIPSHIGFTLHAKVTGVEDQLRAGDYTIPSQSNAADIIRQLSGGYEESGDIALTFIEGWTADDIETELLENGIVADDYAELVDDPTQFISDSPLFDGFPDHASLEGYLFPDTYALFPDSTTEMVITKQLANLESKMTDEMWKKVDASPYSFYELLTLASIIEKEVRGVEERQIAAGIFFSRLDDDYYLQSDATVNYITGKNTTRPTADDIAVESYYNTYKYPGLPPSPIANPGIDSIRAVLNPIDTEYYYFLTTPEPEGKAIFSKTFEEHIQNKNKYYP